MEQAPMQHRAVRLPNRGPGRALPLASSARASSGRRLAPVSRRYYSATAQGRFFNIQIQASWGDGQSSSSGGQGGEAYIDSKPAWGGFFNSSSSSGEGGNGSSSRQDGSPVTRLLSAAVAHVRVAPLPGAAAPWLVLPLLPVVLWCVGWVFTTGMFTLAQTSMSGMCSIAKALYPTIPMRGASYEDVAVSLVKALQSATDQPSTWMRPGLMAPAWMLRWLMATFYSLASAGTGLAGCLMHSSQLLAVTGISKGLLYASCLLFMLPLGSGLTNLTSGLMQRWQQLKAPAAREQDGSSGSSSSGYGSSSAGGSSSGSGSSSYGSGSSYGSSSSSSSGYGSGAAAAAEGSKGFSLPRLSDASALTLKLAGVLAWPCISAAAVLQPSLLLTANAATGPLTIAAPQVLVCVCLLSLLLTVAAAAGRFGWDLVRRQADADTVVDFGLQLGVLCGLQAALNVVQLGLSVAGKQLDVQQLGMPVLSTLILCRSVYSTWRLWRMEAYAPSVWLQVLTLTPGIDGPLSSSGSGSSSGGGSKGGSSGSGSYGGSSGGSGGSSYRP